MIRHILFLVLGFALFSCGNDEEDLPPIEERVSTAINGLKDKLTAPRNGWRLEYQPTEESGIFFMLLDFKENGEVNIQSDVADNDGEFIDQTITYRIDNALGLELIFETFGVFHHLFEQDNASFGAEFEFLYVGEEDENLIFESKSDFFIPSQIRFEQADANDDRIFSLELAENISFFEDVVTPRVFGADAPGQRLILKDRDITIFWSLDPVKRNVNVEFAAFGTTDEEIFSGGRLDISHSTGYSLRNDRLVLTEPLSFSLGRSLTISEFAFSDFSMTGPAFCELDSDNSPSYQGFAQGHGEVTMQSTLLTSRGSDFTPNVYSVNVDFLFDGELNRLTDDNGIIAQKFPEASGFIIFYGVQLTDPDIPIYSLGIILSDGNLLLREYEPTNTKVNLIEFELTDGYFFSDGEPAGATEGLKAVTDEIFEGGNLYAFEIPLEGLELFKLFNPCNQYEIILVR